MLSSRPYTATAAATVISSSSSKFRHFVRPPLQPLSTLRKKIPWWNQILDPGSEVVAKWNHVFLVTCLIAMFIDPLYFYLPVIGGPVCMEIDLGLGILVTFFRTVADTFYFLHIVMKFRTAFVAPSSRVFGRGELVTDPWAIAVRYLKSDFFIDLAASLPLPQIMIWFVIPAVKNPTAAHANHTLSLIVLVQYVPRFFLIFPLNQRIIKTTGAIAKTAWAGAAYNLLLYNLASHVVGACWYVLSIQRQYQCWKQECDKEINFTHSPSCQPKFLDCKNMGDPERRFWLQRTQVLSSCDALNDANNFEFGMFADAFTSEIASSHFIEKYFYCLWWGLRSLSSYGQNIVASYAINGEILFSLLICSAGLVLFSHLIGNMQSYLQSTTARLEEWRVRRRDTEEWMRHRQLPLELQDRVRRFVQYKWIATRGVDEESILHDLPLDLRRQIQRHLCLALVRRVPFFAQMDDQLLDAICERLVSSLNTKDTYIVREGDPVNEMLFIIRGHLESSTTDGGRSGFFNSIALRSGDFCGEELLTWALMPTSSLNLPCSTRTVRSITEVEAFALRAEDLKFVASQFRRLHSKRLQQAFRYYSQQWRTWAACYVQVAWRRWWKRKMAHELTRQEELYQYYYSDQEYCGDNNHDHDHDQSCSTMDDDTTHQRQQLGATVLASKFAANTRKTANISHKGVTSNLKPDAMPKKLFKPEDPDFSADL
ncbi:probable cyclic nucleotide-gated ion channel 16 [Cannabis sativa]|uniref:probable cyclic nucleotide-gated ion channel 16 n=1 Tax=Cannabis sativa TaxID=3483 RepID=UPI0029CA7E90|nr:probable cyclic nucleotide-gated ion channel 16 [Cannabis sativa]